MLFRSAALIQAIDALDPSPRRLAKALVAAIDTLDPPDDLAAIIGSFGDTLDDAEVLALLEAYNAGARWPERRKPVLRLVGRDDTSEI